LCNRSRPNPGNVGMSMSMSAAVLEQAKEVYANLILDKLSYVTLPDYYDPNCKKNYAKDNYFSMYRSTKAKTPTTISMDWLPQNNGIYLLMQNLNGIAYTGDYSYKIAVGMVAEGHADVLMNTINLGIGITFTTQVLPDGRTVPAIDSFNVLVDINRDDINIQIWGNLWSDLAAMCEIFFKSTVVQALQDTTYLILADGIPLAVNYGFAYTDAESNLYMHPTWILDWMTPASAIVAADSLQVGLEGDFWDSVFGEQYPADTMTVLPYEITTSGAGFQIFVSDFTIDSLFNSMIEESGGSMGGWFLSTEVPVTASWSLTTGFLNKFLPGLSSTYGPNQPCDVHFSITSLTNFVSSEANQNVALQGNMDLQLWVHTADGQYVMAVELSLTNIAYQGSLLVENGYDLSI